MNRFECSVIETHNNGPVLTCAWDIDNDTWAKALKDAGFTVGKDFYVTVEDGKIVIQRS